MLKYIIILFSLNFAISCPPCRNGTCNSDGFCSCATGYSGFLCDIKDDNSEKTQLEGILIVCSIIFVLIIFLLYFLRARVLIRENIEVNFKNIFTFKKTSINYRRY